MTAQEIIARLAEATHAEIAVQSGTGGGGEGDGTADAEQDGSALVISEAGEWTYGDARPMRWRAVSRWHAEGEALAVEHVRQGTPARAVLDRQPDGRWQARAPHPCGEDLYTAEVSTDADAVVVTWTISGPCKAARITTRYC